MDNAIITTVAASRLTYLAVLILGSALCTRGIGKTAALGLWTHPITLAGYALGLAALVLVVQGLFRLHLLPVTNIVTLALIFAIVLVKIVLAALYRA